MDIDSRPSGQAKAPSDVRGKLREISVRYANHNRRKPRPAFCDRRFKELLRILDYMIRHAVLPISEEESTRIVADHLHWIFGDVEAVAFQLQRRLRIHADHAERIARMKQRYWSAAKLGVKLGVTFELRQSLNVTTIAPCDVTPAERAEIVKQQNRDSHRRCRRRKGSKPRDVYLEIVASPKPWTAAGVSKATYYRHRKLAADGTKQAA